jgi:hypothetical protein
MQTSVGVVGLRAWLRRYDRAVPRRLADVSVLQAAIGVEGLWAGFLAYEVHWVRPTQSASLSFQIEFFAHRWAAPAVAIALLVALVNAAARAAWR